MHRQKVKDWKKDTPCNRNQKQAGVLYTHQIKQNLCKKIIKSNKNEHCIMIEGSMQQEDIKIIKYMHTTAKHPMTK